MFMEEVGCITNRVWKFIFTPHYTGMVSANFDDLESIASYGGGPAPDTASASADEFSLACREAVTFAQLLSSGRAAVPPANMLELAKRVVLKQKARKAEDVQTWAERLARDVGNATD
jgi:hypothetical protein